MHQFNSLDLEEQLGLRIYNLEQEYGITETIDKLRWALAAGNYSAFDDDFWMAGRYDAKDMVYIQVVQVVNYFGRELVLRFLSFNYKAELEKAG